MAKKPIAFFTLASAALTLSFVPFSIGCTLKKPASPSDEAAVKSGTVDQAAPDVKLLAVKISEVALEGTPVDGKSVKVDIPSCKAVGTTFDCTESIEKAIAGSFPDDAGPLIENVVFDQASAPKSLDCNFATVYTASRSSAMAVADGIGFHSNSPFEHRFVEKAKLVMDTRLQWPKNTKGEDVTIHRFNTLHPCRIGPSTSLELKPFMKFTDAASTVFRNWDESGKNYEVFHISRSFCGQVLQPSFCAPFRSRAPLKDLGKVTATPPADYAKDAPAPADTNLAMKSVYEAMVQIREKLQRDQPGGVSDNSTAADGYSRVPPNYIRDCLGNRPDHWSDIIIHYYCQLGNARSCYTGNIRSGKSRTEAYDACLSDTYFKWVADNQGDVFRYIMFSQVNAFDMEQQQTVINAFYGDMKPATLGEFNPDDANDCNTYRFRRAHDPWDGTHCQATKAISLFGVGR